MEHHERFDVGHAVLPEHRLKRLELGYEVLARLLVLLRTHGVAHVRLTDEGSGREAREARAGRTYWLFPGPVERTAPNKKCGSPEALRLA